MILKEVVDWAMAQPGIYEHALPGHNIAVSRESIINTLFQSGKLEQDEYANLITYLNEYRSDHGLGSQYEFVPPVVPFSQKGIYYLRVHFPSQEEVATVLDLLFANEDINVQPSNWEPKEIATMWAILNRLAMKLIDQTPATLSEEMGDHFRNAIKSYMVDNLWKWSSRSAQFERPRRINLEERANCTEFLDGEHRMQINPFYRIVSRDAYGQIYSTDRKDWPADFIEHAARIAKEFGYYIEGKELIPNPIELPDEITQWGDEILTDPALIIVDNNKRDHLPISAIMHELNDRGLTMSIPQIAQSLFGRQGAWRDRLIIEGYRLVVDVVYRSEFSHNHANLAEAAFKAVCKLRTNERKINGRMDLGIGFPVTINAICIDNSTSQLIYLNIVGSYNAVKANWAALMAANRTYEFEGTYFRVGTAKFHDRDQVTLPSGLVQLSLVHHDAMPGHIEKSTQFAYIITDEDRVPQHFIATLDKLIQTPILSQWEEYLWTLGRVTGLVDYAGNVETHIGCTVWRIAKGQSGNAWAGAIETAIATKEISICT